MKMRAARMVEVGRMVCEEVGVRPPGEGEVLVRGAFASICGSDLHLVMMGVSLPPYPQAPGFPGHEGIGEVEESRHPGFRAGDRVLTVPAPPQSYTFADYQTLPGAFCLKLPKEGDPLHLLMAQQLGTVIFALRRHPVDVVGKTVMVMGQGSAGIFFAFLLKRAGAARVIVSDLSEARLALSPGMGADIALRANGTNVRDTVLDLTAGQGVDYLVEAVGSRHTLLESVDLVRPEAEMLLFGLPDSREPVPFNFHDFFRKRVRAVSTYGAQVEPGLVSFQAAVDLILRREIDVAPLVSHVLPIEEIDRAMYLAHERIENAIKVSLRLQSA
jgi:L-iditol 2-dehydrogenase